MPDYEDVYWQTDYFGRNLEKLRGILRELAGPQFTKQVHAVAHHPGPLHVCLSRVYWEFKTSLVIAKFLSLAHRSFPDTGVEELVELLSPVLRWDCGMEPLAYGLDKIEVRDSTLAMELKGLSRDNIGDVVETNWLIGLLGLSYSPDQRDRAVEELLSLAESQAGTMSAYDSVATIATQRFKELWASLLGRPWNPERVLSDKLWQNALVRAQRHKWLDGGKPEVFRRLLRHVADGGRWPLPHDQNERFKRNAKALGCDGFWQPYDSKEVTAPFVMQVEFVSNPLDILNIDNAFDTCMRLGGEIDNTLKSEEVKLLGWATNVNIRVVAARARDERILGTRVIGLSLECGGGVLTCPTYPKGDVDIRKVIGAFVEDFLKDAHLKQLGKGSIEQLCAPPYCEFGVPDDC